MSRKVSEPPCHVNRDSFAFYLYLSRTLENVVIPEVGDLTLIAARASDLSFAPLIS
jgi:hypothetical protein